jgi:hypothetical protein
MTPKGIARRSLVLGRRLLQPGQFLRLISEPFDELTLLANQYGSDKGTQHLDRHGYTRIYSALLQEHRSKPIRLLEIGLLHPGDARWRKGRLNTVPSLMMWSSYLPSAHIFGFDIADFSAVSVPRVSIYRGDASSRQDLLEMILATGGQFDIIIDDASHASPHQQIALGVLFEHVSPGGLYVIEDLHWQPLELEHPDAPKTREFLRRLSVQGAACSPYLAHSETLYLETHVERIAFFDSLSPLYGGSLAMTDAMAVIHKSSGS